MSRRSSSLGGEGVSSIVPKHDLTEELLDTEGDEEGKLQENFYIKLIEDVFNEDAYRIEIEDQEPVG